MAAESYFEGIELTETAALKEALHLGTNRLGFPLGDKSLNEGYLGYTRMTYAQADEFLNKYKVVHQWSDNPTPTGSRPAEEGIDGKPKLNSTDILANTGFSATLIQARDSNGVLTGEYTLAMRSTNFNNVKLWKDLNQDGISQDSERFTFAPLRVARINVAGTASDTQFGNAKGISSMAALQRRTRAAGRFDCEGRWINAKKCGLPWRLARHTEHGCRVRAALPLLGFEADAGALVRGMA